MDIEKGLNRKETARRDCPLCGGRGFTGAIGSETACLGPEEGGQGCGGTGFQEMEVPYDFALGRNRTPAELREIAFGEEAPAPRSATLPADDDTPFVPPKVD